MRRLHTLVARLAGLFGKSRRDSELEDEIASHFRMHIDDNVRAGMNEAEARRSATIAFGGIDVIRESYRDQRGFPIVETFVRDVRFGCRMLLKSWGLTATAILALAIGIGANIVIFGVANALFLRQPPVREPSRVVRSYENRYTNIPWRHYEAYKQQNETLESLALFQMASISLRLNADAEPEHAFAMTMSPNCFETLGVNAAKGRTIVSSDERAAVVVLSDAAWRRRFGSDAGIAGRDIRINGQLYTVIGVAPPAFETTFAPFAPEFWLPWNGPGLNPFQGQSNSNRSGHMIGRLKPGISRAQAQADLSRISDSLERPSGAAAVPVSVYPAGTLAEVENFAKLFVTLLFVLTGLLLLITCINLATLLLARGSSRTQEVATRMALGAGRFRLVAQLLTESLMLSCAGAVAGLALALVALRTIESTITFSNLPIPIGFGIAADWRVAAFSIGVAMLTALLFGLAPALRISRLELADSFKERSSSGGRDKSRLRASLLIAQVAMSVLLLSVGAALLASLFNARTLDHGFNPNGVLTASLDLSVRNYDARRGPQFVESILERLRTQPGVRSATVARLVPLMISNTTATLMKDGQPAPPPNQWRQLEHVYTNGISRGHFQTLGIPLIAGRDFDARDQAGKTQVAIVNETLARRMWPGENPVGKRMHLFTFNNASPFGPWIDVVGMAKDSKYVTLTEEPKAFAYFPLAQDYTSEMTLFVKTEGGDLQSTQRLVRRALQSVDAEVPLYGVSTLAVDTALSLLPLKLAASVSVALGAVALMLVMIGIFGVVAYLVRQRTREIGIRMALGAQPASIFRTVTAEPIRWTLIGFAIGTIVSAFVTRALEIVFRGIAGIDPLGLAAIAGLVLLTAFAAAYVPARRAIQANPAASLQN